MRTLFRPVVPPFAAAQPTGPVLDPVKKDHRWGYMDMEGRLVIPYRYDLIGEVLEIEGLQENSRGLRLVQIGEGVGLMDNYRNELLPPIYEGVFPLTESLFAVKSGGLFYLRREGENRPVSEEEPATRHCATWAGPAAGRFTSNFGEPAGGALSIRTAARWCPPATHGGAPGRTHRATSEWRKQKQSPALGHPSGRGGETALCPGSYPRGSSTPRSVPALRTNRYPPRAADRNDQPHFGTDSLMRIDYLNQHSVVVVNYLNPGAEIVREGRHRAYSPPATRGTRARAAGSSAWTAPT